MTILVIMKKGVHLDSPEEYAVVGVLLALFKLKPPPIINPIPAPKAIFPRSINVLPVLYRLNDKEFV